MKIPDFVITHISEPEEVYQFSDHVFGIQNNIENQLKDFTNQPKKIVIVSGLSGAGKDSIVEKIIGARNNFHKVKTCTTRKRRPEEDNLYDPYIRVSVEEMEVMKANGDALECVEYAGHYYCTSRAEIDKVFLNNKIPLLIVDPQGARFFLTAKFNGHTYLKNFDIVYIYVVPSDVEELRERLIHRGSSNELVTERMKQSEKDIVFVKDSHYIVVNEFGLLEEVASEVLRVLEI